MALQVLVQLSQHSSNCFFNFQTQKPFIYAELKFYARGLVFGLVMVGLASLCFVGSGLGVGVTHTHTPTIRCRHRTQTALPPPPHRPSPPASQIFTIQFNGFDIKIWNSWLAGFNYSWDGNSCEGRTIPFLQRHIRLFCTFALLHKSRLGHIMDNWPWSLSGLKGKKLIATLNFKKIKIITYSQSDWYSLQVKSHLCIPFLGIAGPQSQFPHSCVCERFIYSQDWSTYFPAAE